MSNAIDVFVRNLVLLETALQQAADSGPMTLLRDLQDSLRNLQVEFADAQHQAHTALLAGR